ncbi:MAG TPA: peptide chain release factor 3 [Bacteroidia bacterium]|nr:peptide chain release factor 3 [Bacteroidia bacterium]
MSNWLDEIKRRRTFAIIAHPDAGKTTLTEKLLLFGGAIQLAGAVKSNKINRSTTSDFMEIEKQRGISVSTSVMAFDYNGYKINILDTPGHEDFAEDTYRTLTAVDSVILVIDCVKGVESQTRKLLEVCRMRNTPVIVFINKLDREGRDPFDLLDEIEKELKIKVFPMTWPIGIGKSFKGVYHLYEKQLNLFDNQNKFVKAENYITINDIFSNEIVQYIGEDFSKKLREDVEVIQGVYDKFERDEYLKGEISPVFFGSAVNNFGIKELLDTFVEIAPSPKGRESDKGFIDAEHPKLTGFIFKIHANLDPKHRDRIAFLRIVSGKFERNKNYYHVRQKKWMKFSNPTAFMAQQKSVIDEAYPGDVIGLYDSGNFKIGDTLTEGEELHFKGIPAFSPEIFKYVVNKDPMKTKQLQKGLEQLTEEGVVQLFYKKMDNRKIVGTVGQLQFEVLQYRLAHEYSAKCDFDTIPIYKAVWLHSNNEKKLQEFVNERSSYIAYDKQDRPVFLAESAWLLQMAQEKYPEIKFYTISEFDNS